MFQLSETLSYEVQIKMEMGEILITCQLYKWNNLWGVVFKQRGFVLSYSLMTILMKTSNRLPKSKP